MSTTEQLYAQCAQCQAHFKKTNCDCRAPVGIFALILNLESSRDFFLR
jgi:hypothetical protein